jgi:endogenous inhibitor of DNA gyrase (YacG/DUF329 family)
MCPNCGHDVKSTPNHNKRPVMLLICPRCGHKLPEPVTLPGTIPEGEGNPVRERKTLLD